MTTQRRTFTASQLTSGTRVVMTGVGYAGVDHTTGRLEPIARLEGTLELVEDRVFLHTLSGHVEELPADLDAIAARVVEIVREVAA